MRTDIHRKSALIPTDYQFVETYEAYLGAGEADYGGLHRQHMAWCLDYVSKHQAPEHGTFGKCTACGANFRHGSLWLHQPTDTVIHLGHDCSRKYGMLQAHPEADRAVAAAEKATARMLEKRILEGKKLQFLEQHKGLEADLALDHHILRDMQNKLNCYGRLTDKQVVFARKLAEEVRNPKIRHEDVKVAAPITGERQEVEGTVISVKEHQSDFGVVTKITVKVQTTEGCWLAWGTAPRSLFDWTREVKFQHAWEPLVRGDVVRFTAKFRRGNEPHFAVFSRPTQGEHVAMDVTRRLTNRRAGVR